MVLRYPSRAWRRRIFAAITYLSLAFFVLHSFQALNFFQRRYDTWTWDSCRGLSPFDKSCTAPRALAAQDVQIVVKTGGSEPQSRLRYQLATMLSNVLPENILIFSDLEEDIESFHIHDVYAAISEQERSNYPEFALYDEMHMFQQQGKDTRKLDGGWNLAKYMNLAMKRKIWKMQHETIGAHLQRKWFVFIDTDTFVEWDNLLTLLEHLDPREKLYIGSPVWLPNLQFAHGGSAYILSYGALEALNKPDRGNREGPMYSQFGVNVTALCCGDEALAVALKQRGIRLKGYWPMLNGEIPATVGFQKDTWCEPVLSLHHLSGTDMEEMWQWVEDWRARTMGTVCMFTFEYHTHQFFPADPHSSQFLLNKTQRPLLFKDLFEYVAPQFVSMRRDWDNTEEGWKIYLDFKKAPFTLKQCEAACEADKLCFQFVFHGTTCALSHTIRLGRERVAKNEGDDQYISGWNVKRIRDWAAKTTCTSAHWLRSNP